VKNRKEKEAENYVSRHKIQERKGKIYKEEKKNEEKVPQRRC